MSMMGIQKLNKMMLIAFFVGMLSLNTCIVNGNSMDPHVFPQQGPFFEGWYLRGIDRHQNVSFGFLFGLIFPASSVSKSTSTGHPLLCASILLNLQGAHNLASPTGCFDPKNYSVLKNGKPVTQNPDDKSPPNFTARLDNNISYVVTPSGTEFYVTIGEHSLRGKTTSPLPWGPNGEGPESWLEKLPLPLHWFVYSLRSVVKEYHYTNTATGLKVYGGSAFGGKHEVVAHMEKNWGQTFPKAWVWAEGVDPATNVSFSLSSGILHELVFDIPAQLSGYRNPNKGIDCSFNPSNSFQTLQHDGCAGTATLDVKSLECHVTFRLSAAPGSFSSCLVTPQRDGFRPGCYESYTAVANITSYQTLTGVEDNQVIHLSALEFGGIFMCNGKCP